MEDAEIKIITAARLRQLLHYNPDTGVFTWLISRGSRAAGQATGCIDSRNRMQTRVDGRSYKTHRLAWLYMTGQWPKNIDHKDGNPSHNWWTNLREATTSQNLGNMKRPVTNQSGYKGVSWHVGGKKWQAHIKVNGINHYLGLYIDPIKAHAAYCEAASRLQGEFARAA